MLLFGFILSLGLYEAVVAVLTLIQNIYLAVLRILEYIEGMTQQLHLQHRLFHVHGLYGKALYADDLMFLFFLVVSRVARSALRFFSSLVRWRIICFSTLAITVSMEAYISPLTSSPRIMPPE